MLKGALPQDNREGNNDMKNTPVMGNLTYTCFYPTVVLTKLTPMVKNNVKHPIVLRFLSLSVSAFPRFGYFTQSFSEWMNLIIFSSYQLASVPFAYNKLPFR